MLKKIIIGLFVFIILLLSALVVLPYIFIDKIEALAKEEIKNYVDATVNWSDMSVSVFKDFPNLTFSLNDLSVINNAPFKGDTLAYIGAFDISLDIMSVIKGEKYDIKGIFINNPRIKAAVNKEGKANWDIAKETDKKETPEAAESSAYSIALRAFEINKGYISFDDDSSDMFLELNNLNIAAKGDFSQDNFLLRSNTSIDKLTYESGAVAYLKNTALKLKADLDINQTTNTYTFKENELSLNALTLGLDGFVKLNDDDSYDVYMKLNTKQTEFKTLLSLLPAIYKKDFDKVKADGKLTLAAFAKGKYQGENYPAFGVDLKVDNAMFQYPSVPTAVKNIYIDLNVKNPGGDLDKTLIDLSRFAANVGANPFLLKAKVKYPISDPDIDAALKGKIDLAKVPDYYPLEGVEKIKGTINADVTAKGRLSAIEKERYSDFDAKGNIDVSMLNYVSKDLPAPLSISTMNMKFNPQNVTVSNLNMKLGKSDFRANGSLDNLLNYIFTDDKLKGTLTVNSNNIDINEFMTEYTTTEGTAAAQDTVLDVKVPDNIDFTFNGNFKRILYDNIELKNVTGSLIVRDQSVRITNLTANIFDGNAVINGTYATKEPGNPKIAFDYDLQNISFQDAFKTFNTFEKYAPIMEHVNGRFNSKLNITGQLGEDLSPDIKTLIGDGLLEMNNVSITGVKVLDKIADKFKLSQLKKLSIDKAWTVFKFKDGRMAVDPFDLKVSNMVMNIAGSHGLDNSLDYNILMDVPTKLLQGNIGEVNNMISKANIPGLSAAQLPENLKLKINVAGMMNDPKLTFGVAGIGGGGSVKDMAKEAFDQKKKELEDKAKAEMDAAKAKAQAELEAKKAEAEAKAKAEAERLKKEAEAKIQAEKEKAKKEAEKQLKDKLKFPR
jgi:hypothetical protein